MASPSPSTQLQDVASLPSGSGSWKYDVFLSFRGEDTRNDFVDHLYSALHQKVIFTFKDDQKLERGESISLALLKAIEESRFAVVVFSKNYASSKWCLEELVKILECQKTRALTVLPVFYKVDSSDLRKQRGRVGETFNKHERDSNEKKVQRWRNALVEAANICGWNSETHGPEAKLVQNIAIHILNRLGDNGSSILKDVVGLHPRVAKVMSLLEMGLGLDDPRVVGICGMGGIGKTIIAHAVYHQIRSWFHASCYILDVREASHGKHGLESLQKYLLSEILSVPESDIKIRNIDRLGMVMNRMREKRLLVVLDDVDHANQLDALVGRLDWFGPRSRIIITTRDNHLLTKYEESRYYNVEGLNNEEAFKLFCCKAFKNSQPIPSFEQLIKSAIDYAKGVPLALRVLGCFLIGRKANEWQSAIHRLRQEPNPDIQKVLKLSYDGLGREEQEIFLDIACFFKWYSLDYEIVVNTLNACGFHANIGIRVLEDKALLTRTTYGMIHMHDLIQDMGCHIVNEESPKESSKRSRLWKYEDIRHTLTNKIGTKAVETIVLNSHDTKEISLSPDTFSKMSNLRLLKLTNVQVPNGLNYLPNGLRILDWHGYPLKYLPSNFQPNSLVTLKMSSSCLKQPWSGRMCLDKLNYVDLSYSLCITKSLDFTQVTNVKELVLKGGTNLVELDPSIEAIKGLMILNLQDCKELTSLPSGICGLKHLARLIVSGCSKLSKLPENLGGLERLRELRADFTAIKRPPSSIIYLKNLYSLSFSGCKGAVTSSTIWNSLFSSFLVWKECQDPMGFELPPLSGLNCLNSLDLHGCNFSEGFLPNDLGSLSQLNSLCLSGTNIISLPESIRYLDRLVDLELINCRKLKTVPNLPININSINASGCTSLETLPSMFPRILWWVRLISCDTLAKNRPSLPHELLRNYLKVQLSLSLSLSLSLKFIFVVAGFCCFSSWSQTKFQCYCSWKRDSKGLPLSK